MRFFVITPCRYASTRFPGKPLAVIAGKPMVQWVYENAVQSGAERVVVATDDQRIAEAVTGFGGEICMTRNDHQSGTDRLAEAVQTLELGAQDIVVNVQGDEPGMPVSVISQVAEALHNSESAVMATACWPIEDDREWEDPNAVKCVFGVDGEAIYFSRAPIPHPRNALPDQPQGYRHIGIYAYRAGFLQEFSAWSPTPLEKTESLEQLRVLEHGRRIQVVVAKDKPGEGIDTPEDLERFRSVVE